MDSSSSYLYHPPASDILGQLFNTRSSPNREASAILTRLSSVAQGYEKNIPGTRELLIDLCQALITTLELPSEAIQRIGWAEPARAAHCRTAIDLNLFDHLKESSTNGATSGELAKKTGAEKSLISRLMKHLAAMHVVQEKDTDNYAPTACSNAFTDKELQNSFVYSYDVVGPAFHDLPKHFKDPSYRNSTKAAHSPPHQVGLSLLNFTFSQRKGQMNISMLDSYMHVCHAEKPVWCDPGFYPISEQLINGFDTLASDVMLIDIGGGLCQDLQKLRKRYPLLPGKLILQDSQNVVSAIPPSSNAMFITMAYDIFTPQPVKHARAYYLHSVLRNWDDRDCVRILCNLKPALKHSYSKVLINEVVVTESYTNLSATSMDQLMLVHNARQERTEAQWRELIKKAGLHVLCFWKYAGVAEVLIEAELSSQERV
ncbi:putative O-methyltransferase [Xylogone sp. PMI_703]|nr:putative O-methyltransferase [Xylogone sp. PMI_703]